MLLEGGMRCQFQKKGDGSLRGPTLRGKKRGKRRHGSTLEREYGDPSTAKKITEV